MGANFPSSAPNLSGTEYTNETAIKDTHPSLHNSENEEIDAIAGKLGTGSGSQTPSSGKLLIGTGSGTSDWSKSAPTGDIVGSSDTQTLTNKTLTSPKINSTNTVTSSSEELNVLDGFDGDVTDLNYAKSLYDTGVTPTEFDALDGINDGWTAFTPAWTNLTPGSGTNTGYYKQIGKMVWFRTVFVYGSGSAVGTTPTLTLPVAKSANVSASTPIGQARYFDANGSIYGGQVLADGKVSLFNASATYATEAFPTASVPFTWTTNDAIWMSGVYEAS